MLDGSRLTLGATAWGGNRKAGGLMMRSNKTTRRTTLSGGMTRWGHGAKIHDLGVMISATTIMIAVKGLALSSAGLIRPH